MNVAYLQSPIGCLELAEADGRLCAVRPASQQREETQSITLQAAKQQLTAYFAGDLHTFDLPLTFADATDFQKTVWQALLCVPFGKTVTYAELANAIGRPKAARAVGNAVGKNPLLIIVPCHRVVAANGLGGFSAGIALKKALLQQEAQTLAQQESHCKT